MSLSNAVPADAVARVIGTKLQFLDLRTVPQRLPIQIALLAPASAAAEGGIVADQPFDFVSAKEVGDAFGYKSPAYRAARILRPETGGGVATIRTALFPIIAAGAVASAGVLSIGIAAVNPLINATETIKVNGRPVRFTVLKTDGVQEVADKLKAALDAAIKINPVDSVVVAPVANDVDIDMTAGWNGESGDEINIEVEGTPGTGIIYTNPVFAGGVGVYDITGALANFGETWFNMVVNAVDVDATVLDQLEAFNGSPETNTGRWNSLTTKPFVALYGSVDTDKDTITTVPDTRKLDLTNSICPAPGSPGFTFEAAAAWATQEALVASDNPPLAYSGKPLLDMPAPDTDDAQGDFGDYLARDFMEKKGVSTSILKGGIYYIEDANTLYHPDGVNPAASGYFRVVHVLGRAFSVLFTYMILEDIVLMNKILVSDVKKTTNPAAIDPVKWKSIVGDYLDDLELDGITTDAEESKATILTGIGAQNPERMETAFTTIFSNNVRQADSTISFGFKFGG